MSVAVPSVPSVPSVPQAASTPVPLVPAVEAPQPAPAAPAPELVSRAVSVQEDLLSPRLRSVVQCGHRKCHQSLQHPSVSISFIPAAMGSLVQQHWLCLKIFGRVLTGFDIS